MRVLIVCPLFPPEAVTSAITAQHIAEGLVERGHYVDVVTSFPSKMQGHLFEGYELRWSWRDESFKNYNVVRSYSLISDKSTVRSRLFENLSFGISSNLNALRLSKPDVVYVNTWPIVASSLTRLFCWLRGVPMVLNIQDVYPESLVGLGHFRANSALVRFMHLVDKTVSRSASHVVVISEEFREIYVKNRCVPEERVSVVYNWYDDQVVPLPRDNPVRESFTRREAKFVAMYAGNVGSVAGLEVLLDAARLLRGDSEILLVISGDGTERPMLEEKASQEGLSNLHFHYPLLRHEVPVVHAAADVLLVIIRANLALSEVPSKLMAYMLSGRPVVAAVDPRSNTASVVRDADCGVVVPPNDPNALVKTLRSIATQPQQLKLWGDNARRFAEQNFSRQANVEKIVNIIEQVAQRWDDIGGSSNA